MQHMHGGIIQYTFDCWADPVVHLLFLKSSMGYHSITKGHLLYLIQNCINY